MAETIKTYVSKENLTRYDGKIKKVITDADTQVLADAKTYADGLADNYDAVGTAQTKVDELANGAVKTNTDAIATLNGADTVEGSVAKAVKDAKDAVEAEIGALDSLTTQNKASLVVAINEVSESVKTGGEGSVVTIDTTTTTEGYAKSYTIKQGGKTVSTIDIPKDMVVSAGAVEVDPVDQEKGTYLVLTLANATQDKIYINVGKLVDIYVAKANATQVQVAIDPSTREISATLVAGSVTATELAADSVVTAKIADGNVTKAKLATDVQTSLGKADTAVQEADLTDLKADVAANKTGVADLKKSLAEGGATAIAIADAKKAGTDAATAVTALESGQVATNKSNIAALTERVDTIEGTSYTAMTDEEIDALFAEKAN